MAIVNSKRAAPTRGVDMTEPTRSPLRVDNPAEIQINPFIGDCALETYEPHDAIERNLLGSPHRCHHTPATA